MSGASALDADPDDPAAELASFEMADGFAANLFASEKDGVIKPIQMRFDAHGRLWVIGSTLYPQSEPGQVPNDKVSSSKTPIATVAATKRRCSRTA